MTNIKFLYLESDENQEFRDSLMVSDARLDEIMVKHAADRAFWSAELARATFQFEMLKNDLTSYDATRRIALEEAEGKKKGRVTDARLTTLLEADEEHRRRTQQLGIAKLAVNILEGRVKALDARKDMTIQRVTNLRKELESQMRVLAPQDEKTFEQAKQDAVAKLRSQFNKERS
jgi:hypothetical protein